MRSYSTRALHCLIAISLLTARPRCSCFEMPNSLESSYLRICLNFLLCVSSGCWLLKVRGKWDIWIWISGSHLCCINQYGDKCTSIMLPKHNWSSTITQEQQHHHLFSKVPHLILYPTLSINSVKPKARKLSLSSACI